MKIQAEAHKPAYVIKVYSQPLPAQRAAPMSLLGSSVLSITGT